MIQKITHPTECPVFLLPVLWPHLVLTHELVGDVAVADGDGHLGAWEAAVDVTVELTDVALIKGLLGSVVVGLGVGAVHVSRVQQNRLDWDWGKK